MGAYLYLYLYLESELNGGSHTVEVIQESFCLARLQNAAGVVNIPPPEVGLHWGSVEGKLFEELHVEVGHHSGHR